MSPDSERLQSDETARPAQHSSRNFAPISQSKPHAAPPPQVYANGADFQPNTNHPKPIEPRAMIVHDTTPAPMIQPQETRTAPDWNATYCNYADEYRKANPGASAEEIEWYAEGCAQHNRAGYASVAA